MRGRGWPAVVSLLLSKLLPRFVRGQGSKSLLLSSVVGERSFSIEGIPPLEIFGVNDSRLRLMLIHFPKLRLIGRGSSLKAVGDEDTLALFELRFMEVVEHCLKVGSISEADMTRLMSDGPSASGSAALADKDILVFGPGGTLIKARTPNQRRIVAALAQNDMLFAIGPAGTGKTYTAVALAVRAWKNREVKRIILTRPAVEAGESIGFLPGDMKEKLDPYLQPLYDALLDMLPPRKLAELIDSKVIQIAPLGFMRGRTLDHAFVILDEAQNATDAQMRMFLTRMGNSAKFVITGDVTQVDLPRHAESGLRKAWQLFHDVNGIAFVELGNEDIVRHPLVKRIVDVYRVEDERSGKVLR